MKFLARRYVQQGSRASVSGDTEAAIQLFERAIRHSPDWSVPWYNLGLTHKYAGNWAESYRCNAEAVRLDPADVAATWNMGIAATALGNWAEARRAWTLYKLPITPGEGPIEMQLGLVPIRINPDTTGEVVWAERIDPARAILKSIPFPESNHRHRDLVLHDGAPVGFRKSDGRDVPVFNELAVLRPSSLGTFDVRLVARSLDDLVAFEKSCLALGCGVEDWSTVRILCQGCSEGEAHEHPWPSVEGEHRFAVAAASEALAAQAVADWVAGDPARKAGEIEALLQPSRPA